MDSKFKQWYERQPYERKCMHLYNIKRNKKRYCEICNHIYTNIYKHYITDIHKQRYYEQYPILY
jgi:hypothetical protein